MKKLDYKTLYEELYGAMRKFEEGYQRPFVKGCCPYCRMMDGGHEWRCVWRFTKEVLAQHDEFMKQIRANQERRDAWNEISLPPGVAGQGSEMK